VPVALRLPGALAELAGGSRMVEVPGSPATVREVLDAVALSHPGVERRVRDETGELRRFVNVYVGDDDVRYAEGQDTAVRDGDVVHVLPSVAGG
jgi:molybdopterin converting factor small subunit